MLCPPTLAGLESRFPDVSAFFERLDYCGRCFPGVPLEESYAHWMSVLPAPP